MNKERRATAINPTPYPTLKTLSLDPFSARDDYCKLSLSSTLSFQLQAADSPIPLYLFLPTAARGATASQRVIVTSIAMG